MTKKTSTPLGTDKLKSIFGEVQTVLVYQSETERISMSVSSEGKIGAYCISQFGKEWGYFSPLGVHEQILAGRPIGETFRQEGLPFERVENCVFVYKAPPELQNKFGARATECFVKQVDFFGGTRKKHYASIVEIYSPVVSFSTVFEKTEGLCNSVADRINQHFTTGKNIYVRRVESRDLESYLELAYHFLKKPIHVGIEEKDQFIAATRTTGKRLLKDPNSITLVAEYDGAMVGYVSANIHPALHVNGQECMAREIFVQEDFRRKGVASSLMHIIERIARERGSKRVSLATNANDEMQGGFYHNQGYQKRCDFLVKYLM